MTAVLHVHPVREAMTDEQEGDSANREEVQVAELGSIGLGLVDALVVGLQ